MISDAKKAILQPHLLTLEERMTILANHFLDLVEERNSKNNPGEDDFTKDILSTYRTKHSTQTVLSVEKSEQSDQT